jgi:uncharacterized membrane protein YkvI
MRHGFHPGLTKGSAEVNRRILAVIWAYLGAVIGAGFASGQELVQFFVLYGDYGFYGTISAAILFALFGVLIMRWARANGLHNYQSVLKSLFGERGAIVLDIVMTIFLFLGTCTMFSACGAVFFEHLNLSKNLGILFAYLGVLLFLFTGRRGMVNSFNLLVPVKILLLLTIVICAAFFSERQTLGMPPVHMFNPVFAWWPIASILYVAYNYTLAMVVLVEYQSLTSPAEGVLGAGIGGLMLGLIAMVCYRALMLHLPEVMHFEVPMLYIAGTLGRAAKLIYTVVLLLGILTTAIANTYGFVQRFSHFSRLNYSWCLVISATMSVPLAYRSFSKLVGTVYPLFGLLGIIILIGLLYRIGARWWRGITAKAW